MKYLLSSGKSTIDNVEYIRDLIKIQMTLRHNEIPDWKGGSDNLIDTIYTDQIDSAVKSIIDDIIQYVKSKFTTINISLNSVEIASNVIRIKININDIVDIYDIKR